MPTHAKWLRPFILLLATAYIFIKIGLSGLHAEEVVRTVQFGDDVDEQVRQGACDVVVEDGEAMVRTDPADPANVV